MRRTTPLLLFALLTCAAAYPPQNAQQFGLRIIVVGAESDAIEIWSRATQGQSFEELAVLYSTDPSAEAGGYLGIVQLSDLSAGYRQALSGLTAGQISPVTRTGQSFVILQMLGLEESRWIEYTDAGLIALGEGRTGDAEAQLERAVAEAEKMGPGDYRLNVSLSTLGGVYRAVGNYDEAERLYRRALGVIESAVGTGHPDYATGLGNLARVFREKGDFPAAEAMLEQAQDILVASLGPNNPNVAVGLTNLARLRRAEGNLDRAESLFEVALSIFEQALGPNDPILADTLEELAAVVEEAGRTADASRMTTRAASIRSAGKK